MRAAYYEQICGFITQDWGIPLPEDFREIYAPDGSDQERAY